MQKRKRKSRKTSNKAEKEKNRAVKGIENADSDLKKQKTNRNSIKENKKIRK